MTQQGLEFLVIQQRKGHWGFPKGHPKKKETPTQTALRECGEETDLNAIEIDAQKAFREHYVFMRDDKHVFKTVTYFLGQVTKGSVRVQKKEIAGYRWTSYDEAMLLLSFPEVRDVLEQAQQYLAGSLKKKILHP